MGELRENRAHLAGALLFTLVATLVVYARVVRFDFVHYDDYQYLKLNPAVAGGLSLDGVRWAFTSFYGSNWHPLTWLSHMLDVELFGLDPGGHHLVNLLFHLANTLLVLLVLARMTRLLWPSTCVALLFALHPLHVESVAYLAERKDLLSCFFWLLTCAAYVRFTDSPLRRNRLLLIALFLLGLLSKPMNVTLPFVLLLLDYWPLGRFDLRWGSNGTLFRLFLEKWPLFLLSGASSVVTYLAQRDSTVSPVTFVSVGNATLSYVAYLEKMLWPVNLAPFYPFAAERVTPLSVAAALSILLLLSWICLRLGRRYPYLGVGWLWYLGTLVPVAGFVPIGEHALADRYTYVPLIGLFIAIVWGARDLASRLPGGRKLLPFAAGALFLPMMIVTWRQVGHWRNTFTLFSHTIRVTEKNWLAHQNLAVACLDRHEYGAALYHLNETVRYKPDCKNAYNNLGYLYHFLDRRDEAIDSYRKALVIDPLDVDVRQNLVKEYRRWGLVQEAEREAEFVRAILEKGSGLH